MTSSPLSRRRALSGAASVGLSLPLLAACGGDGGDGGQATPTDDVSAGAGSEAPTSSDPTSAETEAPAGGLVAVADVPVGSGVIFPDEQVVVTQPTEGDIKVFTAICTHTGCTVAEVTDKITCPCHGSMYDIATGEVLGGPAPAALAAVDFTEDDGEVVLT